LRRGARVGGTARRRGARASDRGGRGAASGDRGAHRTRAAVARAATTAGRRARGRARCPAPAPVGAARQRGRLRAAEPDLDARDVRRAGANRRRQTDRRVHPARGSGRGRRGSGAPRRRRGLGNRRSPGDRLPRVRRARRQDRRPRQPVRERGEARGRARRRDRPSGRAVGGRRRGRARRPDRAARARCAARARARRALHDGRDRRGGGGARARAPRAARRGGGCGRPREERRRRLRRSVVAGRRRRLRDRREPRPPDERLGALHRRPRSRDVLEAGDRAAADAGRSRTNPPDGRGARRRRRPACARNGGTAMRALAAGFRPYEWAPPTTEVARLAGIDESQVLRFDQNTPPLPLPSTRPGTIAGTLARISGYPGASYTRLRRAIADYVGVEPENIVLGAGADDLILLCARAYAGPGDAVAVPDAPTYPLFRIGAELAGAQVGTEDVALTFACRPNNPSGALDPLPDARPLVVDEAYFEYAGMTAVDLTASEEVVVLRTFSKLFGLAGARVGYAVARRDVADELNDRQAPAPVSALGADLAVAALAARPDPRPQLEERERLASALRALGLEPLESHTNFLYVPIDDPDALGDALLRRGLVVRMFPGAFRLSVRDAADDDVLVDGIARILDRPPPVAPSGARMARTLRATAETRLATRLALDGASRVHVSTG